MTGIERRKEFGPLCFGKYCITSLFLGTGSILEYTVILFKSVSNKHGIMQTNLSSFFPKRVYYHTCFMMYKALNDQAPKYIRNLFIKTADAHNRNLGSVDTGMLRVPYSR